MMYNVLLAFPSQPEIGIDTPIICVDKCGEFKLPLKQSINQYDKQQLIDLINKLPSGLDYFNERLFLGECLCNLNNNKIWIAAL